MFSLERVKVTANFTSCDESCDGGVVNTISLGEDEEPGPLAGAREAERVLKAQPSGVLS